MIFSSALTTCFSFVDYLAYKLSRLMRPSRDATLPVKMVVSGHRSTTKSGHTLYRAEFVCPPSTFSDRDSLVAFFACIVYICAWLTLADFLGALF